MKYKTYKLQSAMEYLMTYGWAILIIAIALSALFALGVFKPTVTNACIADSGYLCASPVMNTSGYLSVEFGTYNTQGMAITGLGCSKSSAAPSSMTAVNMHFSTGQESTLLFECPVASNAMGSSFSGTLWVQYAYEGYTGLLSEIGSISAPESTASPFSTTLFDSM